MSAPRWCAAPGRNKLNGRERTVIISVEEYRRLKRRNRQVLRLEDFTDADVAALEETRAPDSSKAFDHELKLARGTKPQ